jgi:hypothetical protein
VKRGQRAISSRRPHKADPLSTSFGEHRQKTWPRMFGSPGQAASHWGLPRLFLLRSRNPRPSSGW